MVDSSPMIRLELRVLGQPICAETPQPTGPIRLDGLLPLLRNLDDAVVDNAVARATANGETISCRRGCSACCRGQPVPIAPAEAFALLLLVEALPEPRQSIIRDRFADRVRRLSEAGLLDTYLNRSETTSIAEARTIAERYFRLGLVCPFLDDDACGIYIERPFVCRQYLVTSPAELCNDPMHQPVKPIPLPLAPATTVTQTGDEVLGRPQFSLPLVLALVYAEKHRGELERTYDAGELFQRALKILFDPNTGLKPPSE